MIRGAIGWAIARRTDLLGIGTLRATPTRICWGSHYGEHATIRSQGRVEGIGKTLIEERQQYPTINLVGCGERYLVFVRLERDDITSLVAYGFADGTERLLARWNGPEWIEIARETSDALYYGENGNVVRRSLSDWSSTTLFPYQGPFAVDGAHIYFVLDGAIRRRPLR